MKSGPCACLQPLSSNIKELLISISLIILCGCTPKGDTYVLLFDHGNGLKKDMPLMLSDKTIGKVESINLCNELKVCVNITVYDKLKIPNDSKFRSSIVKFNLNAIKIELGTSKNYLKNNDTVVGFLHY